MLASSSRYRRQVRTAKCSAWRFFVVSVLAIATGQLVGCVSHKSVREALGKQSGVAVQARRIGPLDLIVSRSYIGGGQAMPERIASRGRSGRVRVYAWRGAELPATLAPSLERALVWLNSELGLKAPVARIEWHLVPIETDLFQSRHSVSWRNRGAIEFWEPAEGEADEVVGQAVRSLAHEVVHLHSTLGKSTMDAEAEERLAYLIEHCAVLGVMGEVRRLPPARLHRGSPAVELVRSTEAQARISAHIPAHVASGTPEADELMTRCRLAIEAASMR